MHTIISSILPFSVELNKVLHLNITDEALPDQATVTDLDFNTNALFSDISTYGREEVESILGYVDEDVIVCAIWPKIQRKVAKIKAA